MTTGPLLIGAATWLCATNDGAQAPAQGSPPAVRPAADPNQKICEDFTVIGSRLAKKRICATRAEWAEMRKQDRDTLDTTQRNLGIGCEMTHTRSSGSPAC